MNYTFEFKLSSPDDDGLKSDFVTLITGGDGDMQHALSSFRSFLTAAGFHPDNINDHVLPWKDDGWGYTTPFNESPVPKEVTLHATLGESTDDGPMGLYATLDAALEFIGTDGGELSSEEAERLTGSLRYWRGRVDAVIQEERAADD